MRNSLILAVFLVLVAVPLVSAVGLIPNSDSYSVYVDDEINIPLTIKGGPTRQTVIFFVKSLDPDNLEVEGDGEWEKSVVLDPAEMRTFNVEFEGRREDSSVTLEWGVKVPPSSSSSGIGFQQVIKDVFVIKVRSSGSSSESSSNSGSSSSSSSGSSSGYIPIPASVPVQNQSVVLESDVLEDVVNSQNDVILQDLTPTDSALSQVIVPQQDVRGDFAVVSGGGIELSESSLNTNYKRLFGGLFTLLLISTGFMMVFLSNNLRSKVYE